jgi:1,4-dihydroxy-2-naphthoyl-CoA synthase
MSEPSYEGLPYEKKDRVVTITMNRPEVYSAFRG